MRKTKIICTLGPATDQPGILGKLLEAGMDVARFNFSHGSHTEHLRRLHELRRLREEMDLPVAAMLDTRGPEIRLKQFERGTVTLHAGQEFCLTGREAVGGAWGCSITYAGLCQDVRQGTAILLDDGRIRLTVLRVSSDTIHCRVENDGIISNNKGVNVPGIQLSLPYMSEQDQADILFGAAQGFDFIAASFVRSPADVLAVRSILNQAHSDMGIIAKIENQEGISHLEEILSVADGIMIARGDMGVEINYTEIPIIQKNIIRKCLESGKPVITATQMLDSMMENPRPTRAEITDVANAIYDGTSAIMLSGETAAGKYPVEALMTMDALARRAEMEIDYNRQMDAQRGQRMSVAVATAHAACTTAADIGAGAIVTVSKSGATIQFVSQFHPATPIVACLLEERIRRRMSLYWGVLPLMMPLASSSDEMTTLASQAAERSGAVKRGDLVVITAGVPAGVPGTTNMIRIQRIGDS